MTLDRWIAVFFMTVSIIYGYASYTYPLLPFELNMSFLPNTLPLALSALAILLSGIIIFSPKKALDEEDEDVLGTIDITRLRDYKIGQALTLLAAMVLYAIALRPVGFLASTFLFLFACSWILGERKITMMTITSASGAGVIWYLVQEVLGIFLKPYPWFIGS